MRESAAGEGALAYVLLRMTFGVVFLFYGIGKFIIGRATVANSIVKDFEKTPLPRVLVSLCSNSLPFILGFCVLVGIFTTISLALMAALLGVLTFGQVLLLNGQIIANNLVHCVIVFLLLFFAQYNTFCLDDL